MLLINSNLQEKMEEPPSELTHSHVISFLDSHGGRCTNRELVSHFRKILNDPLHQVEMRLKFKDIINTIANVVEENSVKYIILKPQYVDSKQHEDDVPQRRMIVEDGSSSPELSGYPPKYQPYWRYRLSTNNIQVPSLASPTNSDSFPMPRISEDHRRNSLHSNFVYKDGSQTPQVSPPIRGSNSFSNDTPEYKVSGVYLPLRTDMHYQDFSTRSLNNLSVSPPPLNEHMNTGLQFPMETTPTKCKSRHSASNNSNLEKLGLCDKKSNSFVSHKHSDASHLAQTTSNKNCDNKQQVKNSSQPGESGRVYSHVNVWPQEGKSPIVWKGQSKSCENGLQELRDEPKSIDEFSSSSCSTNDLNSDKSGLVVGSVREQAQRIDHMVMDQKPKTPMPTNHIEHKSPKNVKLPVEKVADDNVSNLTLDMKMKKQWFLKAAQCDYHGLISLLKKEPRLAGIRDFTSGYTALHWASKHGNVEIVKLIAGTHSVSPDMKSHGGYACIHIASIYKHKNIVDLLLTTYGANPWIRDNSGKRADQYPADYVSQKLGENKPPVIRKIDHPKVVLNGKRIHGLNEKENSASSFIRIGSLNLKVVRSGGVFASVRGRRASNVQRLKTWGSADSVTAMLFRDAGSKNRTSKKKKQKKSMEMRESSENTKTNTKVDSDSDSACGFRP